MRRLKFISGLVALAVCCTTLSSARAQQPPAVSAEVVSVTAGDYPAARAVINLEDASGNIKGLTAANFTATVAGKPAAILSADLASSQNAPLDVLLLMDISGSMAGEAIAQSKLAAKGLVGALAPNDRVAIISFADTVKLVQDYTVDRTTVDAAIDGLAAKGNTALYDATGAAAYKVGTSSSTRRAIILLSDGAQDGVKVKTTRDQALAAASGAGVPFFAIGEGKAIDSAYLWQLATSTRGRYLEAPKVTDLGGLFASIGQLLTSQFIVAFDASAVAGAAEAPFTITLQSGPASATARATLKPGSAFVAPPIALTLIGITAGESISKPRTITAVPDRTEGLTRIAFYVDGVNVYETAVAPYTFTYDPNAFGATPHTMKAGAIAGGQSFESPPLSFTSRSSLPAPKAASGGGLSLVLIGSVAAVLIGLLLVGALVLFVARRLRRTGPVLVASADQRITPWATRHRNVVPLPQLADDPPEAVATVEDVGDPLGVLVASGGPLAGTEFVVGGKPVSIGSGARCAVRINDLTLSAEEARIWVRDGHLMLHKMTRLTIIAEDGISGGWTILEPGDQLDIGEHRFEFRLWTPPLPEIEIEEEPGEVPNILRDPARPRPSAESQPFTSPAPALGLGVIWPKKGETRRGDATESPDLDAQAS